MKESVFKAYDIRGTVGKDFLLESVSDLGYAIAYFFRKHYPHTKTIVIGRDGRINSPEIQKNIINSLIESGFCVIDIGLVPSPVLYFALHTKPWDAGIIVTASHNKKEDNGIKINIAKNAVTSVEIQQIKEYYIEKKVPFFNDTGILQKYNIIDEYINFLKKSFPELIDSSISFVIDCGNGTSGVIIPTLIQEMKLKNAKIICENVDGNFPNHDANPTKIENMQDVLIELKTEKFEVGIGIDADGDRMAAMTASGILLAGDTLLTIFVRDLLKEQSFSVKTLKDKEKTTVVCNVLSSDILMNFLENQGAKIIMVPVGNGIMRAEIKKNNAQLGAETSGHFFFSDNYFGFDDGIYASLRLLELLQNTQKTLDELLSELPEKFSSPEFRLPCSSEEKNIILEQATDYFKKEPCSLLLIDGIRVQYKEGWILIRPSNTESLLSIRFESKTEEGYETLKDHVTNILPLSFGKLI